MHLFNIGLFMARRRNLGMCTRPLENAPCLEGVQNSTTDLSSCLKLSMNDVGVLLQFLGLRWRVFGVQKRTSPHRDRARSPRARPVKELESSDHPPNRVESNHLRERKSPKPEVGT